MKEKKTINIEIGQNIKRCRDSAGLTQERFAELIGLGVKHISAIECGAVGISIPTLMRVCKVLSVSSDEVLFGLPDTDEQGDRSYEVQLLSSRLSHLPANEFLAVKELLDKALAAMSIAQSNAFHLMQSESIEREASSHQEG